MKDVLESLGLNDLFAFAIPGMVVLGSVVLFWVTPTTVPVMALALFRRQQPFLGATFLLISFAFGLLLVSWCTEGAEQYLRASARRRYAGQIGARRRLGEALRFACLWCI